MLLKNMYLEKNANQGLSLVELLVVLVIIGCLSAMVIPSYQKYTHRAKRQHAQSDLYKLQIWLEQTYTAKTSYPSTLNCKTCELSHAYDFTVLIENEGYKLFAIPKTSSSQYKDECFTLVLNHLQEQSNQDKDGNTIHNSKCWR